jgi:transposase-like protein
MTLESIHDDFTGDTFYTLYEIGDDERNELLILLRWNNNIVCPFCKSGNPYITNRGFKCSNKCCHKKFNVYTKTIFKNNKNFLIYFIIMVDIMLGEHPSTYYAKEEMATQKTAWLIKKKLKCLINQSIKEPVYQLQYLLRQEIPPPPLP